jgi:two-component system phosphate regulon sensor histidine kinase PhoR
MQAQAVPDKSLLSRPQDPAGLWNGCHPSVPIHGQPKSALIIPATGAACLVLLILAAWRMGGWAGLAMTGGLLACANGCFAAALLLQARRQAAELERLALSLSYSDGINVEHLQIAPAWKAIVRRMLDSHHALSRNLRDRQATAQKLEVGQRVAQAAQRRSEAVVNSISDAVLVTNAFGEILLANAEAARVFEFELEKVRGKEVREVISYAPVANLIEHSVHRVAGAGRHTDEICISPGGTSHWYKVTTAGVVDQGTEQLGYVTVFRDITPEKAALARSADFVSAVCHEIKTPLASVKAYAEMLADGAADGNPEAQQSFLGIIESQTDRMTRMLESMLDMARIESGVVKVEKRFVSLNELLESGAKLMEPAATEKDITIALELSSLYLGVQVDSDMMSRVIMNLISNAIKYTDRGGEIVLRSQMLQEQALLEVEDNGRGIPAEAMSKLFSKFYRVKENSSAAPGTGLGLSLVKYIVEEVHGGKVEVESEVGKGSIFRVRLKIHGVE